MGFRERVELSNPLFQIPTPINRREKLVKVRFCSLVAFACLCIPNIVSNAQAHCSNATLRGAYVFHSEGTVLPAGTKRLNLAVVTFDGKGTYTSKYTINDNGTILTGTLTGLHYQVSEDCTGFVFDDQGVHSAEFVVTQGGAEYYLIRVPGEPLMLLGFGKRLQESD
jgi:hypothetical protein